MIQPKNPLAQSIIQSCQAHNIKHIVISLINDFYSNGKEFVIDKSPFEIDENLGCSIQRTIGTI